MTKEIKKQFEFESNSHPGTFYTVLLYRDSTMSCNCKGWIFSLTHSDNGIRFCRHTKEVENGLPQNMKKGRLKINQIAEQLNQHLDRDYRTVARAAARKAIDGAELEHPVLIITRTKRMFHLEEE